MFYQTEAKPQGWRAVAVFDDRPDCLIYLGRSSTQVRAGYATAFFELLDDEEREHVRSIALQRWHGAPDAGRWLHQTTINIPTTAKVAASALTHAPARPGQEASDSALPPAGRPSEAFSFPDRPSQARREA